MSSKQKITSKSWVVWGIAAIFYLYEMILRVSPSVMTNDIMVSFNATSTTLGVLISFYYYAYTLFQLPCGVILDKLGPRNLIGLSTILCALGSLLFASTDQIYIAQIGRFLIGAGSACAFISCLQISASMFPKKYFPILAGTTNMMGTLGAMFGGMPVAKAVNAIGWQHTTYWLSALGVVILILVFIFIPNKMEKNTAASNSKKLENATLSITRAVGKIMGNSQIILSGIIAGFMYLPISAVAELWGVPFFMVKYGINNEQASIVSAMVYIGYAIGSVAMAFFARKIASYMNTIKISSVSVALLFFPLIFGTENMSIAMVTVFLIGLFTGSQVINFTCAKNNSDASISGTTLAFTNAIVMLIGSIFQPLLGVMLDLFWDGKVSEVGTRIYEIGCYQKALLTIPICLLIAYLLSLFVRETMHSENEE